MILTSHSTGLKFKRAAFVALADRPAVGVCEATTIRELQTLRELQRIEQTEKLAPKIRPQPRKSNLDPRWAFNMGE